MMEFNDNKPIFMQIADSLCERILKGDLEEESRIPSVRETAAEFQVNPNTVIRSYNYLQDLNIIQNQRGIGYFLTKEAGKKTLVVMQEHFINKELPYLFKNMILLQISCENIINYYDEYRREIDES